jgi:phosphate/sulfate permease
MKPAPPVIRIRADVFGMPISFAKTAVSAHNGQMNGSFVDRRKIIQDQPRLGLISSFLDVGGVLAGV